MKKILLLSFSIFFTGLLQAQQYPLFSNYLMNDYGFNPAVAGSRSYWDVKATYRTQWVGLDGAPETQLISFHGPVKPIGLGGYFFNDTAGRLKRTGGTGTFSYGIGLDSLGTKLCFGGGFYGAAVWGCFGRDT